jgi:hypothetical protein
VHGSDGRRTVAGVGIEGDAVERMNVWGVVVKEHEAGTGGRRRNRNERVGGHGDVVRVDVVGVLEFDVEVVFPTVVHGSVGNAGGTELGGEGDARAVVGIVSART